MIYQIQKWIRNQYNLMARQLHWAIKPPIYMKEGESLSQVLGRVKPGQTIIMQAEMKDWNRLVGSIGDGKEI